MMRTGDRKAKKFYYLLTTIGAGIISGIAFIGLVAKLLTDAMMTL
jgi:hypothetical protein